MGGAADIAFSLIFAFFFWRFSASTVLARSLYRVFFNSGAGGARGFTSVVFALDMPMGAIAAPGDA
jgi:hypothetical protein